ncbi:hypothetical protein, conserved [Eimeria necatrix]|uniref:Transmembrane protein n=1 Tax=Eimeria necatrix TaxID=51315 RepID=U6MU42_9EIME|nr:hypothetical protein, conserved [Eimeria necatrix]CDJ65994.1 hypothetical protein, conserved [Eimeria necatrix]
MRSSPPPRIRHRRLTALSVLLFVLATFVCLSGEALRSNEAPNLSVPGGAHGHRHTQSVQVSSEPVSAAELSDGDSTSSSSATSEAMADVKEALDRAAAGVSLHLPYSDDFKDALAVHKATGICKPWTDPETNTISSGLSEDVMVRRLQQRKDMDEALDEEELEDFQEALDSNDSEDIAAAVWAIFFRPLPFSCVLIGVLVLLLWLLLFVPQSCCARCRWVCCCWPRKHITFKAGHSLVVLILGVILATCSVYMLIHGQMAVHESINAMGASSCSALELVETAEWGDPELQGEGKSSGDGSTPLLAKILLAGKGSFLGVRSLWAAAEGVKQLLSADSKYNLATLIKGKLGTEDTVEDKLEVIDESNSAFQFNITSFQSAAQKHYMKSLFAEAVSKYGNNFYDPFVSGVNSLTSAVDSALAAAPLPSLDLTKAVDLQGLESGTSHMQQVAVDVCDVASPVAALVPFLIWTEAAMLLIGIVCAVVALAFFFTTHGRRSATASGLSWGIILLFVSLGLITTGALFVAYSVGAPLCSVGSKTLWSEDGRHGVYDEETHSADKSEIDRFSVSVVGESGSIIKECASHENYNFLEAAGQEFLITEAQVQLNNSHQALINALPRYQTFEVVTQIEQIQKWVNEFGYLVVYDTDLMEKDPNLKPLLDTFPEVLSSGVNISTRTITNLKGVQQKVYGLADISAMLAPAALEGYKQLSTTLTITAQYPDENDESFKKWVKEIQAKKQSELLAAKDKDYLKKSAAYAQQMRNAVLLCKQKLQLLDEIMPCYRYSSDGQAKRGNCTGNEMFGQPKLGSWNIIEQSAYYLTVSSRSFNQTMQFASSHTIDYINALFALMQKVLKNLSDAMSCSFVREGMIQTTYFGCYEGVDAVWNAAMLRFIGQLCAVLLGLLFFILWRMQKDNKMLEEEPREDKQHLLKAERAPEVFDQTGEDSSATAKDREQPVVESSSMWA